MDLMDSHRLHVKIILNLHAVTCPGVWLCSHGYLEVTIKTLGYFFRTGAMEPYFPLLCHDVFRMEGYFKHTTSMPTLLAHLRSEPLDITLWQSGRRLSVYQGALIDLLHMTEPRNKCEHVPLTQLLMKPTPAFPGIIAPKLEMTADFHLKDKTFQLADARDELKPCAMVQKKCTLDTESFLYKRHCITNLDDRSELSHNSRKRRQQTVCHARAISHTRSKPTASKYNPAPRRVSLASTYSTIHTESSAECDDPPQECVASAAILHRPSPECCQLCLAYNEVFYKK